MAAEAVVEGAVEGNVKSFVIICVWYGICLLECLKLNILQGFKLTTCYNI